MKTSKSRTCAASTVSCNRSEVEPEHFLPMPDKGKETESQVHSARYSSWSCGGTWKRHHDELLMGDTLPEEKIDAFLAVAGRVRQGRRPGVRKFGGNDGTCALVATFDHLQRWEQYRDPYREFPKFRSTTNYLP